MWSKPVWIDNSAPTVNDDKSAGFIESVLWWDTATTTLYLCTDDAIGSAVWATIAMGSTPEVRSASDAVTTAGTVIAFSSAMANTNYTIIGRCYDAGGMSIEFGVTVKTVNGFTATPAINGTLDYQVIAHN